MTEIRGAGLNDWITHVEGKCRAEVENALVALVNALRVAITKVVVLR